MIESKESLLERWDYKVGDTVQSVWGWFWACFWNHVVNIVDLSSKLLFQGALGLLGLGLVLRFRQPKLRSRGGWDGITCSAEIIAFLTTTSLAITSSFAWLSLPNSRDNSCRQFAGCLVVVFGPAGSHRARFRLISKLLGTSQLHRTGHRSIYPR